MVQHSGPDSRIPPVAELPRPEARPQADVVIFDGDCRICTRQINQLARWDRGGRLAYLSLHEPEVGRRYPDLTHEQMMAQMYVVDRLGTRHGGADALRYLSRRLPTLWWLAPLLNLPGSRPLWHWLYRQIADRRYRWGRTSDCTDGACTVHARH